MRKAWQPFLVAVTLVTVAAALRIWPLHALETRLAWLTFYPAVILTAFYGGFLAGFLGTILSCLTILLLWPAIAEHPYINDTIDWLGLLIFIGNCTLISGVAEAMRRARARAMESNKSLEAANRDLEREIARRQEAEEKIQTQNAQLEQRVRERTAELEETYRALRQNEERLRQAFDNMFEGVQIVSFDWRYLYFNDTFVRHSKHSRDDLAAHTVLELYPGIEKTNIYTVYERCFKERVAIQLQNEFKFPDGSVSWFELSFQPVPEGVFIISMDITDRKKAEADLRKLNAELEERVIQRTEQLELSNKELEAFSYSVSHDLRAPLRSIDGFSNVLLKEYQERLDDQGKDYLGRVRAAAQRMGQLIDDLLGLSRVSRAELRRETVDLSAMAQTILGGLQAGEPDRTVNAVIAGGVIAEGDARLLSVVLENLLANAWKFTQKRSGPTIEFGVKHTDGEHAYFVRDNGAGFEMKYADKLFGAFQRLHGSAEFEGTGIGLATVQRIVRRHGGRVWAEGQVNDGATFYFTL